MQDLESTTTDKDPNLMGWWIFTLPPTHPFSLGAKLLHDPVYQNYLDGNASYEDLIRADEAYYSYMRGRAEELKDVDPTLGCQAELFNRLIRLFRETCRQYPGKAPMPPE